MKAKASIYNYIFSLSNLVFVIVSGVFMVPLYLQFIDIKTYGAWLATGNIISLIGVLESGLAFIVTQKLAVSWQEYNNKRFAELSGGSVMIAILVALIIGSLGWIFSTFIPTWVNTPVLDAEVVRKSVVISGLTAATSILFSVAGTYAQVWQQTFFVGVANVISSIIGIATIYLLLINDWNVMSIAVGYLVRSTSYLILLCVYNLSEWKRKSLDFPVFSISAFLEIGKEMTMPFIAKLGTLVVNNSQSFIIASAMHEPAMAAIYDITAKVATTARMFVGMINGSVFASLSLSFATNDVESKKNTFLKINFLFSLFLFSLFLFSFLFTYDIVKYWVGADKFGGYQLLFFIIIGMLVSEIRNFYNTILMSMGEIGKTAIFDLFNSLLYIIFLFFLVQFFGITALPVSLILAGLPILIIYETKILKKINISAFHFYKDKVVFIILHFLIASIAVFVMPQTVTLIDLFVEIVLLVSVYILIMFFVDKRMYFLTSIIKGFIKR